MAGVLIRMKLRVLRHSLRGGRGVVFGVGALWGVAAGVFCTILIANHPGGLTVGTDVASVLFAVWTLGWLFGPVLTGGGDETLRPENFALLPIRPALLAGGLLAAALVGVAPLVTLIAFTGLVFAAVAGGLVAVLVAMLAVGLQLALAVLLSRVVIGGLGALLGSRRGKDLGVLLAALVGLAYLPARAAFNALGPVVTGQSAPVFTAALRFLPTGWGPTAVAASADRDWPLALGLLLALAVLDGLLVLAWSRLLERRLTTSQSAGAPRRSARVGGVGGPGGAGGLRARRGLLPASPLGAVIGKELRMWWRDARRRALLFTSIVLGLILPATSWIGSGGPHSLAYSALWIAFFAALQISNLYGFDGSAVWQTLVTPGAARADVRGRQWAWALIVGPAALAAALVLPWVTGTSGAYPWVLALVPALIGGGAGTIVLVSVRAPSAMPTGKQANPLTGTGQFGFGLVFTRLAMSLLQVLAVIPPVLVLVLGGSGVLAVAWLAVGVGVLSGIGAAWWLGRLAYQRLAERGPELLAAVRVPA
ncbi:MAG: type transport system permease protein [Pseudonocardiales bacterium]|nr:type transport system permease protein [Pseudonocardiales bacterium]